MYKTLEQWEEELEKSPAMAQSEVRQILEDWGEEQATWLAAGRRFKNYMIPSGFKGMIDRYVEHGVSGGSCLDAILSNNLRNSFGRADEEVAERMFDIVKYLYNNVPAACWGSPELVEKWMAQGGRKGRVPPKFKVEEVVRITRTGMLDKIAAILEYNNNYRQWFYKCSTSEESFLETDLEKEGI